MASDKISLIEQCQFLEDGYDTSFVADCLNDPENAHLVFKEARAFLLQKDWTLVLEMASQHHSLKHVFDRQNYGTLVLTMVIMEPSPSKAFTES